MCISQSVNIVTFEHSDFGNKANGVCPIWCGGDFNFRKGGHLILRQLKLAIQFPPGSLAIIPSATLKHGNTSIADDETRVSFTQYTAGGLFRWVQYGFRTWKMLEQKNEAQAKAELAARDTRWMHALTAFSTVDSLHQDRLEAGLLK